MNIARGIRTRRESSGLTRGQLAELVGTDEEQIARYESGEVTPSLPMAAAIAYTFKCAVVDMAETAVRRPLAGAWWACWRTFDDDAEHVEPHPVEVEQHGDAVTIMARDRGTPAFGDAGSLWSGTLRLWDKKELTGWFVTDGAVPARGSLYLTVNGPEGLTGRFVGGRDGGPMRSGWGALARDEGASVLLMNELRRPEVGARS